MTLTPDQRWLLRSVGGWQIRWALTYTWWWDHLMQSMTGCTYTAPGGPEGARGYQCGRNRIVSPWSGDPVVTVTKAQFFRHVRQMPIGIQDELKALAAAEAVERNRTAAWCLCERRDNPLVKCFWQPEERHHPTYAEEEAHRVEERRLDAWAEDVLLRALGFDTAPVQLDLFEVAS